MAGVATRREELRARLAALERESRLIHAELKRLERDEGDDDVGSGNAQSSVEHAFPSDVDEGQSSPQVADDPVDQPRPRSPFPLALSNEDIARYGRQLIMPQIGYQGQYAATSPPSEMSSRGHAPSLPSFHSYMSRD